MKLKGIYEEVRKVTFPHKAVKSHGDHTVLTPTMTTDRVRVVTCDGTVKGAQG